MVDIAHLIEATYQRLGEQPPNQMQAIASGSIALNSDTLEYNPTFIQSLTQDELAFVIARFIAHKQLP